MNEARANANTSTTSAPPSVIPTAGAGTPAAAAGTSAAAATSTGAASATASADAVACPVCGATETAVLGPPAHRQPTTVASVGIDLSDLNLRWLRCPRCEFQFLHPPIPQDRLLRCYAAAGAGRWGTDEQVSGVRFYEAKKRLIERFAPPPGKRVLDFGCFDGGFLQYLGSGYETFGIEPAVGPARAAAGRGVRMLGATAAEALAAPGRVPVDAVVAMDVFEHLVDPLETLRQLAEFLAPGGIVLIETGDTDHPLWRRAGVRYSYQSFVEHVSLFNRRSIAEAGRRAGLELEHFESSSHHALSARHQVEFRAINGAYEVLRLLDRARVPLPASLREVARGPLPRTYGKDHFLAVLRRRRDGA